jgi:hypothetical protein
MDSQPSLSSIENSKQKLSRSMKRTQTPLEKAENIYNTAEAESDFAHRITSYNRHPQSKTKVDKLKHLRIRQSTNGLTGSSSEIGNKNLIQYTSQFENHYLMRQ